MSPGSSTESYPAFARIGLRENPGKTLNQVLQFSFIIQRLCMQCECIYWTTVLVNYLIMDRTGKNSLRHRDSNRGFQLYVLTLYPLSHTGFQFRWRTESPQFKFYLTVFPLVTYPHVLCHRICDSGTMTVQEFYITI
ncbi:hypothetical protein ANN_21873 [Periplaneta americana]|uniref:Uncharacterized protein n=1 Tax=Periplaneta americana TaxID=6978 RepID=A0ABQ8S6K7_PERAM|nr:hypothetical protein ANN_21873 [Periplaneta americana]